MDPKQLRADVTSLRKRVAKMRAALELAARELERLRSEDDDSPSPVEVAIRKALEL